jgi:hypothetical protein
MVFARFQMSDEIDLSVSGPGHNGHNGHNGHQREEGNRNWTRRERRISSDGSTRVLGTGSPVTDVYVDEPARRRWYDPLRLLDAVTRKWYWMIFGAAVLGGVALIGALSFTKYSVRVQLFRRATLNALGTGTTDAVLPPEISTETLFTLMRSPKVLERVSQRLSFEIGSPYTVADVFQRVKLYEDRNPDFVNIFVSGKKTRPAREIGQCLCRRGRRIQQEDPTG